MDINFELYKVFYWVAKKLSFSEASKELFISQSAVSQSIQTLESKIGTALFVRSTKKVSLTYEGKLLLEHIEPAVNLMHTGYERILETNDLSAGRLHLGASDTICRYFLINYLKDFHEAYPNIHLQVTNRTSIACVDLLRQGSVDFIVVNESIDFIDDSMLIQPVLNFKDVFVYNPDFYSMSPQPLSFSELVTQPILMLEKNTATSHYLNNLLEQLGLSFDPSIELGSIDLLIDMAKIGLGISFVPEYTISGYKNNLSVLQLKNELPERKLAAVTHKKRPLSPSSKAFIKTLLSR